MNDGKRARPRWWSRPQGQPPAGGITTGRPDDPTPAPHDPGPDPIPPVPLAPPERRNPTWAVREPGGQPGPWAPPADGGRLRRPSPVLTGALLIALLAGAAGGLIGAVLVHNDSRGNVSLPQAPAGTTSRAPGTVAGIAQATLPGVVYIHVKAGGEEATGTGIILDTAGHILTNNHVVQPAASSGTIEVTFNAGQTRPAGIVGRDTGYDLAVVKVNGVSGLKPLTLGNSSSVRVGDPVIAIGAPYDLEGTVTAGIVSAKDRAITAAGESGGSSDVSYVDAIQTDAPINPGNSGGPLMNSKGQVIGINSAIRSADTDSGGQGGSIGLGFAIPVNQARQVAQQLINSGHAIHPVIGVTVDMRYGGDGARIAQQGEKGGPAITPGGPGAAAGLKAGDIITAVDGVAVHSGEELIVRTRSRRPGQHIKLTVHRGGRTLTVDLVLGGSSNGG
jgi:putative serine protease PepD